VDSAGRSGYRHAVVETPPPLAGAAETLLIPVWARAVETRRPDGLVRDPIAERIVAESGYDFARFGDTWMSQIGVAVRTAHLDEVARAFLARHPDATVVNLGAGLDGRFARVDDGRVRWYEVDFPEVVALRRRWYAEDARHRSVARSVTDPGWLDEVEAGPSVLVIAEGLCMYLGADDNRTLLRRLADRFPGGELHVEALHPMAVGRTRRHDTVSRTGARFSWGCAKPADVEAWDPRIRCLGVWRHVESHPERWRWMRWLRWLPLVRDTSQIFHFRLG
jgi:O-methyltransferase involved in polyketide biosynthesis